MSDFPILNYFPGLKGVVATQTRLSRVDGERGELILGGYTLAELAGKVTFEEVVLLLWEGKMPAFSHLQTFRNQLAQYQHLPKPILNLLAEAAKNKVDVMDALRMGVGALGLNDYRDNRATAIALLAYTPLIVGAYWRLLNGNPVVNNVKSDSIAETYLHALTGTPPTPAQIRALDTYLVTVIEHGLNASTFTARVIISTQSDLISAVTGAIGALKGPLHGGAPGPALDMVFEIGTADCAEPYLQAKLGRGERLMGFGHRVYKVRDPRAEVLGRAAAQFYNSDNNMALYDLATTVEETAVRLLAQHKPGRNLQTNVEYYTALLLHGLGLDTALFTPTFTVARMGGWLAHCLEQMGDNVLFRPKAHYVGGRVQG